MCDKFQAFFHLSRDKRRQRKRKANARRAFKTGRKLEGTGGGDARTDKRQRNISPVRPFQFSPEPSDTFHRGLFVEAEGLLSP